MAGMKGNDSCNSFAFRVFNGRFNGIVELWLALSLKMACVLPNESVEYFDSNGQ